jgi:putative glutamine amidotransferase
MSERPKVLVTLNPSVSLEHAVRTSPSISKLQQTGNEVVVTTVLDSPRERDRKFGDTVGMLLPGGIDIHPSTYGQTPHPKLGDTNKEFDDMQVQLVHRAMDEGRPTLGLCRGAQMISVATEGSLHQNIPDIVGTEDHGPSIDVAGASGAHDIRILPGTKVYAITGVDVLQQVPSRHHQAIDNPGAMIVSGRSPAGIIEFTEHPDLPFFIGEQPHGELITPDNPNFSTLHTIFVRFHDEVLKNQRQTRRVS